MNASASTAASLSKLQVTVKLGKKAIKAYSLPAKLRLLQSFDFTTAYEHLSNVPIVTS